jgi:rubrerythrin
MIIIDFTFFLACLETAVVAAGFTLWYLERPHRKKELFLDPKYIWFCTVCTYTYINTKDDVISVCPRCGVYNKKA